MDELPLDGVRVLQLCPGFAAAFCGRLLGGYGADVARAGEPRGLSEDEASWGRVAGQRDRC